MFGIVLSFIIRVRYYSLGASVLFLAGLGSGVKDRDNMLVYFEIYPLYTPGSMRISRPFMTSFFLISVQVDILIHGQGFGCRLWPRQGPVVDRGSQLRK